MILFSIPVHEQVEVVRDQIENFQRFVPGSRFVLHVARQWLEKEPGLRAHLEVPGRVWVNSQHLYSGHGDGLVLKIHVSNFLHAEKEDIEFEHICLHASNDMFVAAGVEQYITPHDAGVFGWNAEAYDTWANTAPAKQDARLRTMQKELAPGSTLQFSQVEGSFYRRALFKQFAESFVRLGWHELRRPVRFSLGQSGAMTRFIQRVRNRRGFRTVLARFFYPKEEIYPPTLLRPHSTSTVTPYCYVNWQNGLRISAAEVDAIRSGTHEHPSYQRVFAVKRVDRRMDDSLRAYIRSLQ